jgi:hypothetical protein
MPSLSRTPKSTAAISAGEIFVKPEWLMQSNDSGHILPCNGFTMPDCPNAAKRYSTTLRSSLENARCVLQHGGILLGLTVHVGARVAGKRNDAPEMGVIKLLVEIAGGSIATKQSNATACDQSKLIIIATKEGALPKRLEDALGAGATRISLLDLFDVLYMQKLDPIKKSAKDGGAKGSKTGGVASGDVKGETVSSTIV